MQESAPVARQGAPPAVRALMAVLVAVVAVPLLLFVWSAWNSYRQQFSEAADRLRNAVEIASAHAARLFDSHELIIEQVNQMLQDLSDEEIRKDEQRLHNRLRFLANSHDQVGAVFVFDTACRGLVSSATYPLPPTAACAGREYFRVHQQGEVAPDESYVSAPVRGRVTDRSVIIVSKRRGLASGPFSGITAVSVDPDYFQPYFGRVAAMGFTTIVLVREDGSFLARYPQMPDDLTKLPPASAMMETIRQEPEAGMFRSFSPVDQVWRQIAYRKLGRYPVYLTIGLDESAIVAGWWSGIVRDLLFGVPATAALFVLTIFALRRARRESEAMQELQEETVRRRMAEEQLRHAQKMEAIGQLTGGIAHDFNNLLMVIDGSVARLRRDPAGDKATRSLDMIKSAADRGASLTRQLLSFSQLRAVQPRVIDACELMTELKDMLERALRNDIQLRLDLDPAACLVLADRGELDLAILNIAVNARDAMPGGGSFVISVRPVRLAGEAETGGLRGEFVALRFTDSGEGIDPGHLSRVFEPYFTTKHADRGTGLGLSQVYGFAKQAGGHATIESAPGRGTSVTIYLPRAAEEVAAREEEGRAAAAAPAASQSVLLVEDNPEVRDVVADMLAELGHTVHRAGGAAEALERLKAKSDIDRVISDILMPGGVGGLELARAVRKLHPRMPVLLITGYSGKAQEGISEGFAVMRKPFSLAELAAALAQQQQRTSA